MIQMDLEFPRTDGLADEAAEAIRERLKYNVTRALLVLVNSFKKTVGGIGTGRRYRRTKSGKFHTASAPGQPPARDFGDYVNSWDWDRNITATKEEVSGGMGTRLPKRFKWLEYGTWKMRPRPHADLAINNAKPEVERILQDQ